MKSSVPQSVFDLAYSRISNSIKNKKITASDLVVISAAAIKAVQQSGVSDNDEKKYFVIDLLQKVVDEGEFLDDEAKAAATIFIQLTLPTLIDTMIKVAKQEIDIGKIKSRCC
jgi:hypothetical protein